MKTLKTKKLTKTQNAWSLCVAADAAISPEESARIDSATHGEMERAGRAQRMARCETNEELFFSKYGAR